MSKSLMRVHHPASVRSVAFSPSLWQPLQAIVGLDNGSIYRYSILVVIKPVSTVMLDGTSKWVSGDY